MKKPFLYTLLLLFEISVFSQSADDYFKKGQESYYSFQYTRSIDHFENALQGYFPLRKKEQIMHSYFYLGMANYELENISDALDFTIEAMEYGEEQYSENSKELGSLNVLFGKLYHYNQDYDSAILFYQDAIALLDPKNQNLQLILGEAYANLGYAEDYGEHYDDAITHYQKSLEVLSPLLGVENPYIDWLYGSIPYPAYKASQYKVELIYTLKSLKTKRKLYGIDNEDEALALKAVAIAYEHLEDYVHANQYFEQALEIFKSIYSSSSLDMANQYYSYGNILSGFGNYDRAIDYSNKSYQIRKKQLGKDHPDSYDVFQNIGNIYYDAGQFQLALKQFLECQKTVKKQGKSKQSRLIKSLADTYEQLADYEQMKSSLDQLYAMQKSEKDPALINTLIAYSRYEEYFSRILKAEDYLEQAESTRLQLAPNDRAAQAFILNNRGSLYRKTSEYKKASKFLSEALAIRADLFGTESMEYEQSLTNFGLLLNSQENYSAAKDSLTRAYEIALANNGKNHPTIADNLLNLSATIGNLSDIPQELELLQKASDIRSRAFGDEHTSMISVHHNRALALAEIGQFSEAQKHLKKAYDIIINNYGLNSIHLANNYINQNKIQSSSGKKYEAIDLLLKAQEIYQQAYGNRPSSEVALLYNNLGAEYMELNEFTQAELYLSRSLEMYDELFGKGHSASWTTRYNLSQLYYRKSQYDKSVELINKNIQIGQVNGEMSTNQLVSLYTLLASCYTSMNQEDSAISILENARAMVAKPQTITDKLLYADISNNLGALALRQKDAKKALDHFTKTEEIYHQIYQSPSYQLATIHNNLSDTYRQMDDLEKALDEIDKSKKMNLVDGVPKGDRITYFLSLVKEIDILFIQYEQTINSKYLSKARPLLAEARKINEASNIRIASNNDKVDYSVWKSLLSFIGVKNAYYLYQETNDSRYIEEALHFAEVSKVSILLESLQKTNPQQIIGVDSKLIRQQTALTRTIEEVREELFKNRYKGEVAKQKVSSLEEQLIALNEEYRAISHQILNQQNERWFQEDMIDLTSLQQGLESNEGIVEYAMSDSSMIAILITAETAEITLVPYRDEFNKLITAYRNAIFYRQDASLPILSTRITNLIWDPINNWLKKTPAIDRLTIIPEGPLNYLPFEALYYDNQYLIEGYEINYAYSAKLKDWLNKQPSDNSNKGILAVAPVFADESISHMTDGAKDVFEASRAISSGTTRSFTVRGDYISPLPATADEVQAIDGLAKENGKPSDYYLKSDANESFIKRKVTEGYKYLHFATHGFVNEANPAFSGIFLSQQSDEQEDCILFASEIYGLQLKSNLVTLSACETGLGRFSQGEGIVGLTRAFLYAGAHNLLVSQWQVDDRSTSLLMIDFYKSLFINDDKSKALRQAKLNLLTSETYQSPYFWAPFILIGE